MNKANLNLPPKHQPMYGWSLDKDNNPIPISQAKAGEAYFCPVCHGNMIPKRGKIKQHHFAHATLLNCTPENVARAVAGVWIVNALQEHLENQEPVHVTWKTRDQAEAHTINILKDVTKIEADVITKAGIGDITLRDADDNLKVVILLGIDGKPDPEKVAEWVRDNVTVVLLNPEGVRSGQVDLKTLLEQSTVLGGWWLVEQGELPDEMMLPPDDLTDMLREAVARPPFSFYRQLETVGTMSHVLEIDDKQIWLPLEYWQDVIGGSSHLLRSGIEVLIQQWDENDGGHIALFYIIAKNDAAIGIRRFLPTEEVSIRMSGGAVQGIKTSALDIAKQLTGRSMTLPN